MTEQQKQLIQRLNGGLVVSCQAFAHEPLFSVDTMTRMACAAQQGGAAAVRACWPENISSIRKAVDLPIFGINKLLPDPYNKIEDVVITPTLDSARAVYYAGADIIAVDCTLRRRTPDDVRDLIRSIKADMDVLIMGEVSTLEEGLSAEQYGVDIISTTIAGYTHYSRPSNGQPDYALVSELVAKAGVPINAEGRYQTPEQVKRALALGAWTVTVGSAITRPQEITRHFVSQIK